MKFCLDNMHPEKIKKWERLGAYVKLFTDESRGFAGGLSLSLPHFCIGAMIFDGFILEYSDCDTNSQSKLRTRSDENR